ncbi:hypothetical protein QN372_19695 [Undibacterium sp. RTI2.1]|uniref:hypothetical protein n=1 Tax=unclassified Undibacterium TaxID=2630295 RepID=UPI002B22E906|nr:MULTISPECIES: hypothetical protein [unclassified Undibacterium]MEB0032976.1 hypothetical protein [Undibacterium sp. RTI2.1]MEB0118851.1 hypothetical protein [Undibacterium sp. RTI2.2]
MCPKEDPYAWVSMAIFIVLGILFALTVSFGISYLKKKRQARARSKTIEETTLQFIPPGNGIV